MTQYIVWQHDRFDPAGDAETVTVDAHDWIDAVRVAITGQNCCKVVPLRDARFFALDMETRKVWGMDFV